MTRNEQRCDVDSPGNRVRGDASAHRQRCGPMDCSKLLLPGVALLAIARVPHSAANYKRGRRDRHSIRAPRDPGGGPRPRVVAAAPAQKHHPAAVDDAGPAARGATWGETSTCS